MIFQTLRPKSGRQNQRQHTATKRPTCRAQLELEVPTKAMVVAPEVFR